MIIIQILILLVPILLCVAFFTLLERNLMASIQRRTGPNVSGFFGVLQPIYDVTKLALKEPIQLSSADQNVFILAPIISLVLSQAVWSSIPISLNFSITDSVYQALFLIALSSIGIYGILLAGWSSNSKYAFLGCCRSVAQMVSYELPMGVIILCIFSLSFNDWFIHTLNLNDIQNMQLNNWFFFVLMPISFIWLISVLAETNRAPFDLPEAEAELVAGYNVEFGALSFALFFVAEYGNMVVMVVLTSIYLFGGCLSFFIVPGSIVLAFKLCFLSIMFVWVRATLPRYRYDQLMHLGWKVLLPFSICWLILHLSLVVFLSSMY